MGGPRPERLTRAPGLGGKRPEPEETRWVWDLPVGTDAAAWEEPVAELAARLEAVVADATPLDADERRAREGLKLRQVRIR